METSFLFKIEQNDTFAKQTGNKTKYL